MLHSAEDEPVLDDEAEPDSDPEHPEIIPPPRARRAPRQGIPTALASPGHEPQSRPLSPAMTPPRPSTPLQPPQTTSPSSIRSPPRKRQRLMVYANRPVSFHTGKSLAARPKVQPRRVGRHSQRVQSGPTTG